MARQNKPTHPCSRCAELELLLNQSRQAVAILVEENQALRHELRRKKRGRGKAAQSTHDEIRRRHFKQGQSYGDIAGRMNVSIEIVKNVCMPIKQRQKRSKAFMAALRENPHQFVDEKARLILGALLGEPLPRPDGNKPD
jgi:hypothetical protein